MAPRISTGFPTRGHDVEYRDRQFDQCGQELDDLNNQIDHGQLLPFLKGVALPSTRFRRRAWADDSTVLRVGYQIL